MKIYLAQCLCPQRHCFLAEAAEDTHCSPEELKRTLQNACEAAWRDGELNKRCEICSATEFTFEVGLTKFKTKEEAKRVLAEEEQKQLATRISDIWGELCRLAQNHDAAPLNQLPGLWEHRINEQWNFKLNGHGKTIDNVPPFSCMAWFNGWPFACFDPFGGDFGHGELANVDTFLAALRSAE